MATFCALPTAMVRAQAQTDLCPENRADNPSFEYGFSTRERPEEVVANAWHGWFEALPGVGGINYAPRFTPMRLGGAGDAVPATLDGLWSQEMSTSEGTHVGGLWQQIAIPSGSQVYARAYGYAWASSGEDPSHSEPPGLYSLSIGVDALGGTNPKAATVIWSPSITTTDVWSAVELDTAAEGPLVTLFLEGHAFEPLAHNVSRWDAVCFRVLGPQGVATEPPTRTPLPPATLAPGAPTYTPGRPELEATATALAMDVAATQAAPLLPRAPGPLATVSATAVPDPAAAAADEPGTTGALGERLRENVGLLFLGLAGLLAGVAIAVAWGSRRP